MSENILTERRGHVLVITINRPHVRNSFDLETADAMSRAADLLDDDPELRVGVITGAGGLFSAGMDMKAFLEGNLPYVAGRGVFGIINQPPTKPLIAAIEGAAIAGGFELMLVCDLVVAAEGANFALPEVKRGLVAGSGGLMWLPKRIPPTVAAELTLTGSPIGAERAHQVGLVNRVVADGAALGAALELATEIASNAPLAVEASKRVLDATLEWSSDEEWAKQGEIVSPVFDSEDAREGARAFKEKRQPEWKRK